MNRYQDLLERFAVALAGNIPQQVEKFGIGKGSTCFKDCLVDAHALALETIKRTEGCVCFETGIPVSMLLDTEPYNLKNDGTKYTIVAIPQESK